jgi:peptidyl-prolyl cis-trans isomerase C
MFFLGVCCSGCRRKAPPQPQVKEPNTAQAPAEMPATTPVISPAEKVVVTVNGTKITESQLEQRVDLQFRPYAARAANLPPSFAVQLRKQIRQGAIEGFIVEHLLDEKVKEAKIEVTDDEVTERINSVASSQNPPLSVDDFKARLTAQGADFNEVRQQVGQGLRYQKLMESQWAKIPPVNEVETRKYYDENEKEFNVPEQVRASHILISPDTSDPNADPNVVETKARTRTEELLKQIKDGADFAELAKANSSCPSAAKGGDLGFFARGNMVEAFEKVAFALKPGDVSDVVATQFGYHIIKVTDHKDPAHASFEEAKEGIIEKLEQQKKTAASQSYIESLKSKASIVYAPGWEPKPQPKPDFGGSSGAATTR